MTFAVSVSAPLPCLTPVDLVPSRPLHHANIFDATAATVLARLVAIEVATATQADGTTFYAVRLAIHSTCSRIPVAVVPGQPLCGLTKDVVVAKNFAAFRRLRDDVYDAAQGGHNDGEGVARSCAFCASVIDAVILDQLQPHRYDQWIRSPSSVCTRLTGFLQDLVGRARGDALLSEGTMTPFESRRMSSSARPRCFVQAHVQSLVMQFLQLDPPDASP